MGRFSPPSNQNQDRVQSAAFVLESIFEKELIKVIINLAKQISVTSLLVYPEMKETSLHLSILNL